jgi:hypothetical protein
MFSDLFVAPKQTSCKPKQVKKLKKTNPKTPIAPSAAEQTAEFGPFEHVVEESPEAAVVENALDYEDIDILDEEWPDDCCSEVGSEINYEATSVDMSVDETECVGSMTSSPGFIFKRKSVEVEKARPSGISLTFDDDSWID